MKSPTETAPPAKPRRTFSADIGHPGGQLPRGGAVSGDLLVLPPRTDVRTAELRERIAKVTRPPAISAFLLRR